MITKPTACPLAPGPLEEYAAGFDDLFTHVAQRRGFLEYLAGLLAPRERNKTLTALAGISRRAGMDAGYGTAAADSSRLPEEARYLASLPVTQAIATRLDTRAAGERARAHQEEPEQATASWSVPALVAAGIPALILLVVLSPRASRR